MILKTTKIQKPAMILFLALWLFPASAFCMREARLAVTEGLSKLRNELRPLGLNPVRVESRTVEALAATSSWSSWAVRRFFADSPKPMFEDKNRSFAIREVTINQLDESDPYHWVVINFSVNDQIGSPLTLQGNEAVLITNQRTQVELGVAQIQVNAQGKPESVWIQYRSRELREDETSFGLIAVSVDAMPHQLNQDRAIFINGQEELTVQVGKEVPPVIVDSETGFAFSPVKMDLSQRSVVILVFDPGQGDYRKQVHLVEKRQVELATGLSLLLENLAAESASATFKFLRNATQAATRGIDDQALVRRETRQTGKAVETNDNAVRTFQIGERVSPTVIDFQKGLSIQVLPGYGLPGDEYQSIQVRIYWGNAPVQLATLTTGDQEPVIRMGKSFKLVGIYTKDNEQVSAQIEIQNAIPEIVNAQGFPVSRNGKQGLNRSSFPGLEFPEILIGRSEIRSAAQQLGLKSLNEGVITTQSAAFSMGFLGVLFRMSSPAVVITSDPTQIETIYQMSLERKVPIFAASSAKEAHFKMKRYFESRGLPVTMQAFVDDRTSPEAEWLIRELGDKQVMLVTWWMVKKASVILYAEKVVEMLQGMFQVGKAA